MTTNNDQTPTPENVPERDGWIFVYFVCRDRWLPERNGWLRYDPIAGPFATREEAKEAQAKIRQEADCEGAADAYVVRSGAMEELAPEEWHEIQRQREEEAQQ